MNLMISFLEQNRERLQLDRLGPMDNHVCIQVTPRYRTSGHVVFLMVDRVSCEPKLVLKAARLSGGAASLKREAESLRSAHDAHPHGYDSIPQPLACVPFNGTQVLLETGLSGRPVTERVVRRRFGTCRDAVLTWIQQLHAATLRPPLYDGDTFFQTHVAEPLAAVERVFPDDHVLLARTREALDSFRGQAVPRVLEHGDLSAPNLLLSHDGRLRVVDWELATCDGLPGADLFFASAYLAFARYGGRTTEQRREAFRRSFVGGRAWARPIVQRYREGIGLDADLVRPLIVLCWLRYVARLAERLCVENRTEYSSETTGWLRQNRYFELWHDSILHYDQLLIHEPTGNGSVE